MTEVTMTHTPQSQAFQMLPDSTRLWIYQSGSPFPEEEIPAIRELIARFAENWVSHNRQLRAYGDLLFGRFVLLMVDESQAGASGCSIDKSVYFLKSLAEKYQLDLFDRMTFAWLEGETVRTADRDEFARLYEKGVLSDATLVFDNLVQTKGDFEKGWLKPLGKSWHKRMV